MTDEKKHQNVLDKLRCLEEFRKPEHKRKTNAQLGIVAAELLGKVKPVWEISQQMENTTVRQKRRQKQTTMSDFMKKAKK